MCVELADEYRCIRCRQVRQTQTLVECWNGPCRAPTRQLRSQTDIRHSLCFDKTPFQPVYAVPPNMANLHTPGAAVAAPILPPTVAVLALVAANFQRPAANTDANPAAAIADGPEQSGEMEAEVNFGDFVHDDYGAGPDNSHSPPAHDSELDAEGETDPDYQAPAATIAASDDDTQVSYDSELDAEGETDPDYAAPVSAAPAPATSNSDDDYDYDDDSTERGSPDVGSIYEDSDEDEARAYAYAPHVTTRAQAHGADNTAAAVEADAEADDADDEASTTSSNIYDA